MKKLAMISTLLCTLFLFSYCDAINSIFDDKKEPNEIGGDTNVPIAQVGNQFSTGTINVAGQNANIPHTVSIIKNESGVATVNVKVNIATVKNHQLYQQYKNTYNLDDLINRIPASYKDVNGNIDGNVKIKITSEGIQDFINRDGKAHTIVKFDAKVGDEYNLTKSGGQTLRRTVTQKSTTDDFSYGFMNIKTITTEQSSSYPGVKKIVYKSNHKFGIVHVEIQLEDGSKVSSYVYSTKTN
jgi:hypothetical protein